MDTIRLCARMLVVALLRIDLIKASWDLWAVNKRFTIFIYLTPFQPFLVFSVIGQLRECVIYHLPFVFIKNCAFRKCEWPS